jgi:hypothetical protein
MMQIKINESIARDATLLREVIYCLSAHSKKHSIETSSTIKLMEVVPAHLQEMVKRLVTMSSNRSYKFSIEVDNDPSNDDAFCVEDLNQYLSKSSVVIMENENSDGLFLDVVLRTLEEHKIIAGKNDSWEIRGAGGCGEIVSAITNECVKFKKKPRIFVIHDSDLTYPGQPLGVVHENIKAKAQEAGVHEFMLQKREVENYIPDDSILHIKAKLDVLSSFTVLTKIQKDFFDYKKGLSSPVEEYQDIYNTLSDETKDKIRNGFGKHIGTQVFSSNYNFTKETFDTRCATIIPEFEKICKIIKEIL